MITDKWDVVHSGSGLAGLGPDLWSLCYHETTEYVLYN